MATSNGNIEMVGPNGLIPKNQFVKLITGSLISLGYHNTASLLQHESGIPFLPSQLTTLIQFASHGRWDDCISTLSTFDISDQTNKLLCFVILEHKFLQLVQNGDTMDALFTLRNQISPLSVNTTRLHELAACLIVDSHPDTSTNGTDSRLLIVEKLQQLLPASVVVPESRLELLVEQALRVQWDSCVFHNTLDNQVSLYTDHHCGTIHIPSRTVQILEAHNDEVWYLQFSHNGKYLASASKDRLGIIWEVHRNGKLSLKHVLIGHQKPVLSVSWSPDDTRLLTCGQEEAVRCWDVESGECLRIYEKSGVGLISCGWLPNGKGIFAGLTDKTICLWDLNGTQVECWKGQKTLRISDMVMTSDGKRIISICRESTIMLLDREDKSERLIEEDQVITSFSLSNDSKFLLVNLINQEIHLWSIDGDVKVVSKYRGHKRSRFVIRSCFGGIQQAFIASGSEDSQVYIWHRSSGELLEALQGHSGAVNCVSWNPNNPHMLASASDDRTIRIWGIPRVSSNGYIHHLNGSR